MTGDRCTPSNSFGTALSTVTGGTKIYVSDVTSNAHNESKKDVMITVSGLSSACDGSIIGVSVK